MLVFLVTGAPGAGKSTVARRLQAQGHHAVSTDSVDGLCSWRDSQGCPVTRPARPGKEWLSAHGWAWDPARLDEIIAGASVEGTNVLWLCGDAVNALTLADKFDAWFVLAIDQDTMIERLSDPRRGNDYGRVGDTVHTALATHAGFLETWRAHGATIIDAAQDLDTVVEELLLSAAFAALHLRHGVLR